LISDLSLRVLRCRYFDGYSIKEYNMTSREVYDYEIELYLECDGGIYINGKFVSFKKGDINFRKPSQIVCGLPPYKCILICFDVYSAEKSEKDYNLGLKYQKQPNISELDKIPDKLYSNPEIERAVMKIYKTFDIEKISSKGYLYILLSEILKAVKTDSERNENVYIRKALKYISKNYCDEINIEKIAKQLNITPSYFHNIFKKSLNTTPKKYINGLRIEKAKYLIQTTDLPIDEIGYECGFLNHVYFSYAFRISIGITATEYRNIGNGEYYGSNN